MPEKINESSDSKNGSFNINEALAQMLFIKKIEMQLGAPDNP